MILSDGVHGSNSLELKLSTSSDAVYNQGNAAYNHPLAKTSAAKYSIKIMNLPSTSPQVIDTLLQIMSLDKDTTINVYMRKVPVVQKESITANVFTSDDFSQVKNYFARLEKKSDGSAIDSAFSKNTNSVKFSNVDKGIEYLVQVVGSDTTRPLITTQDFAVTDTIVNLYAQRFLKPAVLNPVPNFSMKEDMPPADSLIATLSSTGYDKNGNIVPDSMDVYQIVSQSDSNLVKAVAVGNKIKLAKLAPDGNGYSDITARIVAPNGKYADQVFRANVTPMRDVRGTLTDDEGNAKSGYVMLVNTVGDTVITKADSLGHFALQTNPTSGDTLKAHILNPNHNEAFVRTIYLLGGNDVSNHVVDAVPLLPDTFYCGADTVRQWLIEGNFEPIGGIANYWGLKKVDLNNFREVISSINLTSGDTMKVVEQTRILNDLQINVDNLFTKKPGYYIVPQDSGMIPSGYRNAINQFKDHTASNGLQTNWDDNSDGMLDGRAARYGIIMYLVSPGDTIFNDRTINREDFMMRIMPNAKMANTNTYLFNSFSTNTCSCMVG
jgi:hypothetical protein